ncbi:MAG TPA: carboxymuconolactone decarboxylase family protein [Pseudonocardiaceae bacterium]|nr:carboxymuconolactone decarboxylase family protein [Pseudonocardiaceae bacterium]
MTPTPVRLALRRSLHEIRYTHAVPARQARGVVASVYRQLEREFGLLAPPIALHSAAPAVLAAAWLMLRESLVAAGTATRADKEAVATAISAANACPYCVEVHSMTLDSLGQAVAEPLAAWATGTLGSAPIDRDETELAELVGVAVTFHYLNRMVNVFLGPSPLPARVPESARPMVRKVLGRFLRPSAAPEPGQSLDLLPAVPIPPADLGWARGNPTVRDAFARAGAALDVIPDHSVPESVRQLVLAELVGWDGTPMGLSRSWVAPLLAGLRRADRATARLALLTAFSSAQVDAGVIAEFREHNPSDRALIEVTGWASLAAARALGARIPLSGEARAA